MACVAVAPASSFVFSCLSSPSSRASLVVVNPASLAAPIVPAAKADTFEAEGAARSDHAVSQALSACSWRVSLRTFTPVHTSLLTSSVPTALALSALPKLAA